MTAWPAGLPQKPRANTFSGGPQTNVQAFNPDVGPPITRRRSSAASHVYSMTFDMTSAQVDTFETFFTDTLGDGADSFTWDDPRTDTEYSWKFADAGSPYQIEPRGPDQFAVQMSLIRLPG